MENAKKDMIDLLVAIDTEDDPQIAKVVARVKAGFNAHAEFKYGEALRRAQDRKEGGD